MSNILFSGLSGDLRLAAMISSEINLLLRDTANLRNTGYLQYGGSINGLGSNVIRLRKVGLMGRDSFAAPTNEDDAASSTALTDGHADITVARQVLLYQMSDLAGLTGYGNSPYEIDPFNLAASISASYETRFAELTATAAASATAATATTGTTMSVSSFFEAIFNLEKADTFRGAPGPFYCVMHPKSLTELQASLRSEQNNIIANMSATEEMIKAKGIGYAGNLFGVDVYRSSHIATDGTDYPNWMADAGALAYADGVPTLVGAADSVQFDKCVVEMSRTAEKALTAIVGHAYLGLSIIDQNRICRVLAVD
jgi:hypothetical protein